MAITPKIPAAMPSRSWIATTPYGLEVNENSSPRIAATFRTINPAS
jgi:hypothetical protein